GKWRRIAQVGFYDIYVSRNMGKKLLKRLTSPLAPARVDAAAKPKYSGLNAQTSVNSYYH
ncbi:MAG: hypothetical protein PHU44_07850, partial [Syntrophales bacterium]|nr:hypothetical protein [Syntrophales bacterium]